jgi:hypothetical protein
VATVSFIGEGNWSTSKMKNLFYIFISNLGIFPLVLTCDIIINQQTDFDTGNKK